MVARNIVANHSQFITRYTRALDAGDVALFVGAGLSRAAGYVDWRALLRGIAGELGLDVDRETDLIAIAQYHLNEKHSRGRLNQAIIDELAGAATLTRSHSILARLPIPTVWTTNYDQLLERSLEDAGKVVDLKLSQENLAQTKRDRDVVLYKMHGCVTQPHEAVLTKDDYEQYAVRRPLFVESLKGDLIAKTFLFVGFSFADPNIDYILSRVRVLLGTNVREHFCVMRFPQRPKRLVGREKAAYEYQQRATALRQADLLRFGVETVWVDEYSDVEPLLASLSAYVHRKAVFVSGAAHDPDPLGRGRLDELAREIGARLIREGFNFVSGFGLGLGEQCVVGALRALYGVPRGSDAERLVVRPFPKAQGDQQRQNTRHREDLIARSGIVVVLAGNRAHGAGIEDSPGVLEEVEIGLREHKCIIPIGATGHVARQVWERANADQERFLPGIKGRSELAILGRPDSTNEQILNALFRLLVKAERAAAAKS